MDYNEITVYGSIIAFAAIAIISVRIHLLARKAGEKLHKTKEVIKHLEALEKEIIEERNKAVSSLVSKVDVSTAEKEISNAIEKIKKNKLKKAVKVISTAR